MFEQPLTHLLRTMKKIQNCGDVPSGASVAAPVGRAIARCLFLLPRDAFAAIAKPPSQQFLFPHVRKALLDLCFVVVQYADVAA